VVLQHQHKDVFDGRQWPDADLFELKGFVVAADFVGNDGIAGLVFEPWLTQAENRAAADPPIVG
jgi:hypothetical protein